MIGDVKVAAKAKNCVQLNQRPDWAVTGLDVERSNEQQQSQAHGSTVSSSSDVATSRQW